jgi:hypothetical protein
LQALKGSKSSTDAPTSDFSKEFLCRFVEAHNNEPHKKL